MTGLGKYYCMNWKFIVITEGPADLIAPWKKKWSNVVIPLKKIFFFYITISPVLKYFCSEILMLYPETAKQPY